MEPDDEKETLEIRFRQSKNAADIPIPFRADVAEAIDLVAEQSPGALLALLLKMVLKDRITDDEIQLICDVYYHD